MAILVSGASGFLGSRLIERLAAEDYEIIAIARSQAPESLRNNRLVRWIARDIARDGLDLCPTTDASAEDLWNGLFAWCNGGTGEITLCNVIRRASQKEFSHLF